MVYVMHLLNNNNNNKNLFTIEKKQLKGGDATIKCN